MAFFNNDMNPEVLNHLQLLARKTSDDPESFLKDLKKGWLKKEKIFMKQLESHHMTLESSLSKSEKRAFVILTYSGSILGVGPALEDGSRQVIYASVGLRREVPEKLMEDRLSLKKDVALDREAEFAGGSLKKSSPVYKIAVMNDAPGRDQTQLIEDATRVITREFVSVNNTIVPE